MHAAVHSVARRPTGLVIAAICLLKALGSFSGGAQAEQELVAPEYTVKAAFLYNFAKLVEWPATAFPAAETPLTIGVLGADPFNGQLDNAVKNKQIEGRRLVVQRFPRRDDLKPCHILFISTSEKADLPAILTSLQGQPILTVGETDRFASQGGTIQLLNQHDAIRFAINTNTAARAHLKLSSKLLRLATELLPGQPQGGH